jgi:ribose transport system substrate-binding protein
MNTRHRIAAAIVAPLTLVALAACADTGGGGGDEPIKITLVQGTTALPFAQITAAGATAAMEEVGGIDFDIAGPANIDPAAEVKIFQQVVATRPDGILLQELPPELFTRPVEDAEAAGIVVLPYTIAPAADSTSTSFVGDNGFDLGRAGAEAVADALIEQFGSEDITGDIVTGICVPGLSVLTSRIDGFKERITERLPGVNVLDAFDSKGDPAQNFTVWQQAVSANPDAIAMMSPCEADVQNLIKIKEDSGAEWQLAGFDINEISLQGVRDGTIVGLYPQSSYMHGYVGARILAEALKNGTDLPKGWVEIPVVPVTADNVDEIAEREASDDAQAAFWQPYIDEIFSADPLVTRPLEEANK